MWAMPLGPARDAARAQIADAIGAAARRRARTRISRSPRSRSCSSSRRLWQDDPSAIGRGLGAHVDLLHRLRATFAKSGALEPALDALAMLAEVEPSARAARLGEIDEILEFAGGIAAARGGSARASDVDSARPIALLQPTVIALPLPWLVDRYVAALAQRQRAIRDQLAQGHALELVGELHDVALHRAAGSPPRSPAPAASTRSRNTSRRSTGSAKTARCARSPSRSPVPHATPAAYVELARMLRSEDHDQVPDPAARARGVRRRARAVPERRASAVGRRGRGRVCDRPARAADRAVSRCGRGRRGRRDHRAAARPTRRRAHRPARVRQPIARGVERVARAVEPRRLRARATHRPRGRRCWRSPRPRSAAACSVRAGFAEAEHALTGSLDHAPSIDAYEALTVLYFKTSRLGPRATRRRPGSQCSAIARPINTGAPSSSDSPAT